MKKQNKKAAVNYLLTFPVLIYLIIIAAIFFGVSSAIFVIKSPSLQIPLIKSTEPNNILLQTLQVKLQNSEYSSLLLDAIVEAEIAERTRFILQEKRQKEINPEEQKKLTDEINSLSNKRAIVKDSLSTFLKNQQAEKSQETCLIILQQPEEINIDPSNKNTEDLAYKANAGQIIPLSIAKIKEYKENNLLVEIPAIKLKLQNYEEISIEIKYYYGECR